MSPKASRRLAEGTASGDNAQWHLYDGASHCALHDADKRAVWDDIVNWIDRREKAPQTANVDAVHAE